MFIWFCVHETKKVSHFSIIEITHLLWISATFFFDFSFSNFHRFVKKTHFWCLITDIRYWFHSNGIFFTSTFSLAELSMFFSDFSPSVASFLTIIYSFMSYRRWRGSKKNRRTFFLTMWNKCTHVDEKHDFFVFHSIRENIECN